MASGQDPAVRISHATLVRDHVPILADITADIPRGKITGFLGPSGAGKTSLIRAIVGRSRLTGGEITLFGLPAGHPKLRHACAYMTQGLSIYRDLKVEENFQYFARMGGHTEHDIEQALADVHLAPLRNRMVRTLSGGEQARVSLGIALLGYPDLLILDEPTVGVDPVLRKDLWRLFGTLAARGTTLIVSSHVMDEAEHCDALLLIRDGHLLAEGTPHTLMARTKTGRVEDAFLALVGED